MAAGRACRMPDRMAVNTSLPRALAESVMTPDSAIKLEHPKPLITNVSFGEPPYVKDARVDGQTCHVDDGRSSRTLRMVCAICLKLDRRRCRCGYRGAFSAPFCTERRMKLGFSETEKGFRNNRRGRHAPKEMTVEMLRDSGAKRN
jgi:hypothetical protein